MTTRPPGGSARRDGTVPVLPVAVARAIVAASLAAAAGPTGAAGLAPTYGPRVVPDVPNVVVARPGVVPGDAHWQTLFVLHCSGCHRADGSGHARSVPDLRDNLGHFMATPEGRRFVLQVPGVKQARVSDEEVAQLTNWMLRTFAPDNVPPGTRPYGAEEVRAARRSALADVSGERRRVVAALRARGLDAR